MKTRRNEKMFENNETVLEMNGEQCKGEYLNISHKHKLIFEEGLMNKRKKTRTNTEDNY